MHSPNLKSQDNMVTYLGSSQDESINSILKLSDNTYLIGGSAEDLSWLDGSISQFLIQSSNLNTTTSSKIGFILHLDETLETILSVSYFLPKYSRNYR